MRKAVGLAVVILAFSACKSGGGGGTAGTGGVAGTGVAGSGTSGTGVAGSGVSGTGAAGMSGGAVPGCEAADKSMTGSALHAAVAGLLMPQSPCGFSSCHTGNGKAMLTLMGMANFKTALVGKPSCEAPPIPLVDGSGGDAALKNSWVWLKLTAPIDANSNLVPQATWPATPGTCGQTTGFGLRMPMGSTDVDTRVGIIRNWICAGAPGP